MERSEIREAITNPYFASLHTGYGFGRIALGHHKKNSKLIPS
ncbi:hypothetical protein CbuG_0799 [Coxiella burnetii CbuG_Q212]|nr:hypothetical protein CbuG_0799 [Coxiella burnetii CbuG_Q212]